MIVTAFINPVLGEKFHLKSFEAESAVQAYLAANNDLIMCEDKPHPDATWNETGWNMPVITKEETRAEEIQWRDIELTKVLDRIDQYEKDQNYPVELRTSPFTAEQYHKLLQDRKRLSDYPSVENFPFTERPILSGLV